MSTEVEEVEVPKPDTCEACSKSPTRDNPLAPVQFAWRTFWICGQQPNSSWHKYGRVKKGCLGRIMASDEVQLHCVQCGERQARIERVAGTRLCEICEHTLVRARQILNEDKSPEVLVALNVGQAFWKMPSRERRPNNVVLGDHMRDCLIELCSSDPTDRKPHRKAKERVVAGDSKVDHYMISFPMRQDRVPFLRDVVDMLHTAAMRSYANGHAEGNNLILGLADGSMSVEAVSEASIKAGDAGKRK